MTRWLRKSFVRDTIDKSIDRIRAQKASVDEKMDQARLPHNEEARAIVRYQVLEQIDRHCNGLLSERDYWCAGWFPWVAVPFDVWRNWHQSGQLGIVYAPPSLIGGLDPFLIPSSRDYTNLPS
jgi:hypothetical protein